MSLAWKGGSTSRWRRIRAEVLDANVLSNGGRCCLALAGEWDVVVRIPAAEGGGSRVERRRCTGYAEEVHHTLGKAVTGDDLRYLQAVCQACNRKVGEPLSGPDPAASPVTAW